MGKIYVVTQAYKQYPDLNHWTDEAIAEFLKGSLLNETNKKQLLEATDKTAFYQRTIYWYEIDNARKSFDEFHNYLLYNKILLSDKLYIDLSELDGIFSELFIAIDVYNQVPIGPRLELNQAYREFHEKTEPIIKRIEKRIQRSLNS